MNVYELNLNGKEHLKSMYSIYVIVLNNNMEKYYYIGQTGDRKHLSARSPFYRLTGHLDKQESSTQNQIYKGIMEKILKIKYDKNTYENVENYFENLQLKMYNFPIFEFNYNATNEEHTEKRQIVEVIENILLNELAKIIGKNKIINKKYSSIITIDENINEKVKNILEYILEKES